MRIQAIAIKHLKRVIRCCPLAFRDGVYLLAFMCAVLLAIYKFNVFENVPGVSAEEHVIVDATLAAVSLFAFGLLVLCLRFLFLQRREMALRIKAEHQARELAHLDALTGLPNRRQFDRELNVAIDARPRAEGAHAVFLLDLNDFKHVNDVYGHATGDQVLIAVAMRLRRAIREGDLIARLGGDEFSILARQLTGAEEATNIALRIITEFEGPITIEARRHQIGVSVGIALFPQDGQNDAEILRKADIALYRAKAKPGSSSCFFDETMDASIRERDLIEVELHAAIRDGAVQIYYQPLVDLRTEQIAGFEALARWTHQTLGNVPPDRFIPIAESCGLMNELTDHLLRQASRDACQWPANVTLAFNISPSQLQDRTFGLRVLSILAESGLSPRRLEIEITESALVQDVESAQQLLGELHDAGVRIALDDFGTGYSSLYHLRKFKVDKIKIDRSFVANMEHEPGTFALVRGLLGLGHGLGLTVTAEGVELPGQAASLLEQGCEQAQGYLYARAMSAADAADFITIHNTRTANSIAHIA